MYNLTDFEKNDKVEILGTKSRLGRVVFVTGFWVAVKILYKNQVRIFVPSDLIKITL